MIVVMLGQHKALAFERARILEVSITGRSLILDRGSLDTIREGDLGRFLIQQGPLEGPALGNVAVGEAVKVYQDKSFWYLYAIYDRKAISKDGHLLYAVAKDLTRGRKEFRVIRHQLIATEADAKKSKKTISNPQQQHSIEKNFIPEYDLYDTKLPLDNDVQVEEFSEWEKTDSPEYIEALGKEMSAVSLKDIEATVETETISRKEKERIAQGMVDEMVVKINETKGHLGKLYRDQVRDPDVRQMQKYTSSRPLYFTMQEDRKKAEIISPDVKERIEIAGKFWSGDMSDEQMRRFFIESGLMREHERRRLALESNPSHEFMMRLNYGLTSMADNSDPNYQAPSTSVLLAYEWHMMRTAPNLKRWGVELGYEYGSGRYNLGENNVGTKESGIKGKINYYFMRLPSTIGHTIGFAGLGLGLGSADASAAALSREYSYSKITMPSAQLGFKYRLRSGDENDDFYNVGFGFQFVGTYETHKLSTNEELVDNISGSKSFSELKFSLGLSIYL